MLLIIGLSAAKADLTWDSRLNRAQACRLDKERENAAALEVFTDLLTELDAMGPRQRLTSLIEGVLAANIFDWGARACVDLYHQGTILEIYRYPRSNCLWH